MFIIVSGPYNGGFWDQGKKKRRAQAPTQINSGRIIISISISGIIDKTSVANDRIFNK